MQSQWFDGTEAGLFGRLKGNRATDGAPMDTDRNGFITSSV
jgi:hypothetical protein